MKNIYAGKFILIEGLNGAGKTTQAKLLVQWLKSVGVTAKFNHEPTKERFGYLIRKIVDQEQPYPSFVCDLRDGIKKLLQKDSLAQRQKYPGRPLKQSFLLILKRALEKLINQVELTEEERQVIFVADRFYDVVLNIIPKLESGTWIVQDRYDVSNYIHSMASGLSFDVLHKWHNFCMGKFYLIPDLVIYYWAPMDVAMRRNNQSGKIIDIYEKKIEFLKSIERAALELFHIPTLEPLLKKGSYCKGILKIQNGDERPYYWINAEGTKEDVFKVTQEIITRHFEMK
ncbi:MAG TPA: hypothetical protein PLQ44_01655 [Candidatus Paceibacterota bacterium]|nr:hypothetical protein [Candidatus Paceibacterota bacterium]HPT40291.1 hypothetical protein [Candidatus Paceibacterota bacterium]